MTTTALTTKIREVVNKIPHASGLASLVTTTAALNTKIEEVENKISDNSGLIKKTDRENISLMLIMINLRVAYFIQR